MNLMSLNGEKWIAVLSDGRVMDEDALCDEPKRISPWSKLQEICIQDDVHVTLVQLHVLGRVYQSPIRSHDASRTHNMEPFKFIVYRKSILDGIGAGSSCDGWIGSQCEFRNGAKLTTWVNVHTGHSYTVIE